MKSILYKNKNHVALYFITTCGEIFSEILWAYVFMITFNFATGKANITIEKLLVFSLAMIVIRGVLSYWNDVQLEKTVISCTRDFKECLINRYIDSEGEKSSSEILNIITQITLRIEDLYLRPLFSTIRGIIFFIGSAIAIFRIQAIAFFFIVALSWIPVAFPQIFNRKNRELREKSLKESEYYLSKMKEITAGFDIIKSFHIESVMKDLAKQSNDTNENARWKANRFQIFHNSFSGVLSLTTFIGTQLVSAYLAYRKIITVGDVIAITQLSNYIALPITVIPKNLVAMNSMKGEIRKLDDFLEKTKERSASGEFQLNQLLSVESLCFSYGEKEVLHDLSLQVGKNEKIAIVGESGSGKSTLAKILLRRLQDFKGTVQFDGFDLRNISSDSFYRNIAPVTQQVFLFNDTIRNNITLYQPMEEEMLQEVVKQSGLSKVLENLPNGLDTMLGEYGTELSGGEKQRISIARCLVKKAKLIIMDEATSALDQHTARGIEQTLLQLNTTVVMITHRVDPTILQQFDHIYVLKNGSIVENGAFEELEFFKTSIK